MIEVVHPGLLATIQDFGRHGLTHLGVSPAGAADLLALRVGNALVGNTENTAAIEFTLSGALLRFHCPTYVSVNERSFCVSAGETLRVESDRIRSYLCVAGGLQVAQVLGSASTHLPSGLGGGALRKGDRIGIEASQEPERRLDPRFVELTERRLKLRITGTLSTGTFTVQPDSNRQGIRLSPGTPLEYPGEILSEGVPLGAIQILPNGSAIVLFVDSQTTGGYPVAACVIAADMPSLGQLRPGDRISFESVSMDEALTALREQEEMFQTFLRTLA